MLALVPGLPKDNGENFESWLKRHGQTRQAIRRFWEPVLVSALNEDLELASPSATLRWCFAIRFSNQPMPAAWAFPPFRSRSSMGPPHNISKLAAVRFISGRAVDSFRAEGDQVRLCVGGEEIAADYAVLATPFNGIEKLLPDARELQSLREQASSFESSPITGIHLWFDREITPLEHAVLLERTIQWMFHKSKILATRRDSAQQGSYLELVVSSSKTLVDKPRLEIIDLAVRELAEFFPTVREATLTKATVVKEIHATFAPSPGSDAFRPSHTSPWPRLFLAGDWTATAWPATMEGAVRSGYGAVEVLSGTKFLVPDLPAKGLMTFYFVRSSAKSVLRSRSHQRRLLLAESH